VHIAYEDDAVLVEVVDDGGQEPAVADFAPGSGAGLLGIRERVALVGGELEAGRRAGGGYVVSARLPHGSQR
jgi:signal transduction histidine kinase